MQNQGVIIGNIIRMAGYSQREVADIVGVREDYFSRTLKKEPVPRSLVIKIAQALGVTEQQILDPATVPPRKGEGAQGEVKRDVREPTAPYLRPDDALARAEAENRKLEERIKKMEEERRLLMEALLKALDK